MAIAAPDITAMIKERPEEKGRLCPLLLLLSGTPNFSQSPSYPVDLGISLTDQHFLK